MHTRDIVALIAVISVVVCVVDAKTQRDTGQFSFAIIVDSEPGQKLFADKLQSLLEAEAAVQWDGRLVERADMDKLLEELKISASGIADPNSSLKLSQILNFDCLLAVKTKTDSVIATVSLFPSTLVIYEKTYTERLEPHSLAVNIVTNAIRAVREHSRDADKPQVSIGSFYNVDPHRKFLDFSIDVSLKLRQELVKNRTIILTERLFPSDLLSEFELARGGFTEQIAKNLSAPPSDILLYGEFQTKSEQNLNEPFAELNFTLLVVSPTGMCENHKVEFSCRSNEQEVVIEQVLKIIRQAVSEVRTKLDAGKQRSFSQREFEEFKKQAFRLMPNPPMHDLYGRLQFGKREELERALHMLECAMLFKGDDVQILLSMGAVFDGMRRARQSNYSPSDKEFFTKICQELVERAYYIGSDKNTRYCYWYYFVYDGLGPPPPGCIQAAKYIWDTRKSEYWERDHIHFSLKRLLESDIDTQLKYKLFLEEVSEFENAHRGLLTLGELFRIFEKEIRIHDYNTQFMNESLTFAQHLLNKESIYIKALGHVLNFTVYFRICEQNKDTEALKECTKHFREAIDLLADLHEKYDGNVDLLPYSYMLLQFYDKYDQLIKKFGLENDSAELKEKYITIKLKAGDYGDDGIPQLFHTLLPQLWEQSKYERGCELLTDYLENLDLSNISIDIRSYFIGEYNRFLCAMQGRAQIGISIDRFEKIEFDDNLTGNVNKIVASENSIYGIRSQFVTHTSGRAFKFTPA
ncbi:MAG: hypothetical protein JW715_01760, partial [Sedimentisphaerales bacterium]|nr:hypothetical protein [Sedimentisphaerales bacterium]